ncbi:hypothetical protein [Paraliobacillus sp. JSM ZJ581]|uniref:hypothetical protein n=1 Tax=Paraliobacillus sp. JSM ZJ581 TaxID=3342118 RepID=UPI0035A99AB2
MNQDVLWGKIKDELNELLLNEETDYEVIEDLIYLLLLKRMWYKDKERLTLSNQRESNILNQIEQVMEKDKHSFESVLTELNKIFY